MQSLREATLEALTGMKVPSALGEHGGSSLPESCWSLLIKRPMLSLNLLALRITVNDCGEMDSSFCVSYAWTFYPAGTTQPIQVMLPVGSWPCWHWVTPGNVLQPATRATTGKFCKWIDLETCNHHPGI